MWSVILLSLTHHYHHHHHHPQNPRYLFMMCLLQTTGHNISQSHWTTPAPLLFLLFELGSASSSPSAISSPCEVLHQTHVKPLVMRSQQRCSINHATLSGTYSPKLSNISFGFSQRVFLFISLKLQMWICGDVLMRSQQR